jgi:AcrR family transcriptional regulator
MRAAAKLFAEASLADVSVAQILAESGVKAPTLYHHFRDKEGLYVAWCLDALERVGARFPSSGLEGSDKIARGLEFVACQRTADVMAVENDLRRLRPESASRIREKLDLCVYAPLAAALAQQARLAPSTVKPWVRAAVVSASAVRRLAPWKGHGSVADVWPEAVAKGLCSALSKTSAPAHFARPAGVD